MGARCVPEDFFRREMVDTPEIKHDLLLRVCAASQPHGQRCAKSLHTLVISLTVSPHWPKARQKRRLQLESSPLGFRDANGYVNTRDSRRVQTARFTLSITSGGVSVLKLPGLMALRVAGVRVLVNVFRAGLVHVEVAVFVAMHQATV
ncbi:MAG: hypothetical protein HZC54_05330 [Verrucomicrobia bacterium]|nr:hypothetical protein [Verrucomicrobiota bacterium]